MGNFTDLTGLSNVQPINLSFDNLTDVSTTINAVRDTAQNSVGNYWFVGAIMVLFFMLIWWFYRPDQSFALDMTRAIFISSSWCLSITVAFLLSGWVTTIVPIIWFSTTWTISLVGAARLKAKGF